MNKHFKKWLWETDKYDCRRYNLELIKGFDQLKPEMQWGVYLAYFDSVGIIIDLQPVMAYNSEVYTKIDYYLLQVIKLGIDSGEESLTYDTRKEAQKEAIDKAFKILEQQQETKGKQ